MTFSDLKKSHHSSVISVPLVWNEWVSLSPMGFSRSTRRKASRLEVDRQDHRLAGMPDHREVVRRRHVGVEDLGEQVVSVS